MNTRLLAALLAFGALCQVALGQGKPVTVSLVSEQNAIVPGETFTVGLKMLHAPQWHSYWTNPGIGQPTVMEWQLPEGFSLVAKLSPRPEVKLDLVVGNQHIYHGTIYHLFTLKAPQSLTPGQSVTLQGTAKWLQCLEDRCDPPQSVPVALQLPVAPEADANPAIKQAFDQIRADQPVALEAWEIGSEQTEETYTLILTPKGPEANPDPGAIYIFEEAQALDAVTPTIEKEGEVIKVSAPKYDEGAVAGLTGFLYAPNGWLASGGEPKAMRLAGVKPGAADESPDATPEVEDPFEDAPTDEGTSDASSVSSEKITSASYYKTLEPVPTRAAIEEMRSWGVVGLGGTAIEKSGFLLMLVFAFLGGMILNLMPCVFPVIGIKIMGFVHQAGEDIGKVRRHGLVYAAGVIASLWVLVAVLLLLRAAGEQIGWGFQLQSPTFVGVMLVIMFVFGLNLTGLFEIGTTLVGAGAKVQQQGYRGSFFSGILAVMVATPCTGPFMGAALGFALAEPAYMSFLIFTALAVGLALPYVLLSWFPFLVDKLPRPGAWMETFKQFMSFPLFATAIWLLAIFAKATGEGAVTWMLVALLVVAFGLWIYGRYGTFQRKERTRWIARLSAVAAFIVFGFITVKAAHIEKPAPTGETVEKYGMTWHNYSPQKVVALRNEGKGIFIDFTAVW